MIEIRTFHTKRNHNDAFDGVHMRNVSILQYRIDESQGLGNAWTEWRDVPDVFDPAVWHIITPS